MRKLLLAVLACVAMPANATLIQIDVAGIVASDLPHHWTPEGERPSLLSVSMLIDTMAASPSFLFGNDGTGTCLYEFRASPTMSLLDFSADGEQLSGLNSGAGWMFGGRMPSCRSGEHGNFSGGFGLTTEEVTINFQWEPSFPVPLADLVTSADPIADMLLATSPTWLTWSISAGWGDATGFTNTAIGSINIHEVPEPGTLGLLGIGLIGVVVAGRRSRTRRI